MGKVWTEIKNDGGGDYEVIHMPNTLRAKVGSVSLDAAAIERAEEALRSIADSYPDELARNVAAIASAWLEWQATPADDVSKNRLATVAHDIKGQAGAFNYPLAADVATSLGVVLRHDAARLTYLHAIVKAHIDALTAISVRKITGDGGPVGRELIADCAGVSRHWGSPRKRPRRADDQAMTSSRITFHPRDGRRDRRYPSPTLLVTIGGIEYATLDWSLGGFRIGNCERPMRIGQRLYGSFRLVGQPQTVEFTATVVRLDEPSAGQVALQFLDLSERGMETLERFIARRLFRD